MNEARLEADLAVAQNLIEVDSLDAEILPLDADMGVVTNMGGTKDYRKLGNKPTINGTELFDNYDEIDPTVPEWAKQESKPSYTAQEVGAVDEKAEMTHTDLNTVWGKYFV